MRRLQQRLSNPPEVSWQNDMSGTKQASRGHGGNFRRRMTVVFALQLLVVLIATVMAVKNVAPVAAVLAIMLATSVLSWLAISRAWSPIETLAKLMDAWDDDSSDAESLQPTRLAPRTDAGITSIARGLHTFAVRVKDFGERERNFTRDASHELRSPLTVIKMSADMLAEETNLSSFGARSLDRIRRSSRELEALVEAFLVLSRESDKGLPEEDFIVNRVLQQEVESAAQQVIGRDIQLVLEEPSSFALHGSPRVFAVLVNQLLRHAIQQTEQGKVVVTVMPGVISVTNHVPASARENGVETHGFDMAIARRLSDRFQWPIELSSLPGTERIARVRFPNPQPVS
jgi:two-component system sensor histidine kinase QseC